MVRNKSAFFPQKQRVFEWQLAHPSGSAECCLDWIKELNGERTKKL